MEKRNRELQRRDQMELQKETMPAIESKFSEDKKFLCGDQLTIADLCIYFDMSNLIILQHREFPS